MNHPILQSLLEAADALRATEDQPRPPIPLRNGDNIARIVFKDEGRDEEGRVIGPSYAENAQGRLAINYGWVLWRDAERLANALGVEFREV